MLSSAGERRSIRRRTARVVGGAGNALAGAGRRLRSIASADSLEGDRWVEWSFCMARLAQGEGKTLDFGAGTGFLSLGAAQRGHHVVALDREPAISHYSHERVEVVRSDILDRPLADRRFDQVINCSSVEHVGLAGRYGSTDVAQGDIEAMAILRSMLVPGGRMILTIPAGRDMVCPPLHRIYGEDRLPRLIEGFDLAEQQYWRRDPEAGWRQTERAIALATEGSESFYSLGLFVLAKPETA
jgi:SAM-dependent methyltransferase